MLVGRGKRVYLLALVIRLGGERAERALHRWIERSGLGGHAAAGRPCRLVAVARACGMMGGMRGYRMLALVMAVVVLAGCGRSRVVREYPHRGGHGAASALPPVRVSQPKYGATAVVQRGQTVYRIATENGITALDLALWNDIPPPYTIYPGQRLRLYPERPPGAACAPRGGGGEAGRHAAAAPSRRRRRRPPTAATWPGAGRPRVLW